MKKNIHRIYLLVLLGSLLGPACLAESPLSVGIKAGLPLTYSLSDSPLANSTLYYSKSRDYIVGPSLELRLPFHFSVEADALYHPFDVTLGSIGGSSIANATYSVWEFPVLAKFHFGGRLFDPFVEAGPEFRTRPNALVTNGIVSISRDGFVAGGGLSFNLKVLRISPEIRYTRWGSDSGLVNTVQSAVSSNQNQAAVLLGITF